MSSATPSPPGTDPARTAVWTVLDLLRWTTDHFERLGIQSPRLDAECLLAFALGVERLRLYIDFDKPVNEAERAAFRDLVRRRASLRVPVSQLVGGREFWSLALTVTPDVLTPRPETETVVSAALDLLPDRDAPARVLDVGTGSGAIALAIARERPRAVITATDISQESLKIAQENAERHEMAERIQYLEGDLLEPVAGATFDLVVSNPPYLAESERGALPPELAHEPDQALFAGADGLAVLSRLAAGVGTLLAPGAAVVLEIAPAQARDVVRMLEGAGLTQVGVHRDLGGHPRVVTALRGSTA